LEVNIRAFFSPSKVNGDGEISISDARIVNARAPVRAIRLVLNADADQIPTGMQLFNLKPTEFIRKSRSESQVSSRDWNYRYLHGFCGFSIRCNHLS
jgi:hypothetical protein